MKRYFIPIAIATCIGVSAQTVTIKKIELASEKVIIHYDLEDANTNHEYLLNVFSSKDDFTSPLAKVTGDVGQEIKPGADKKISWDIAREYGTYKGRIALEIRGKVYVPFVKLQNFDTEKSYKRGKTYVFNTKVGSTNPIHVELFNGSQRVSGDMNHPNNGTYALSIPLQAKKGDNYRLKITDSRNNEEVIYSPFFKVRPRIPLLIKVLPIVVVGGVVAALAGGGSHKDDGSVITKLPNPPTPTN